MTSREIIWQHAFDYRWARSRDMERDQFVRARPGKRDALVVVYFASNGRVVSAYRDGSPMFQMNRNSVMDALEDRP